MGNSTRRQAGRQASVAFERVNPNNYRVSRNGLNAGFKLAEIELLFRRERAILYVSAINPPFRSRNYRILQRPRTGAKRSSGLNLTKASSPRATRRRNSPERRSLILRALLISLPQLDSPRYYSIFTSAERELNLNYLYLIRANFIVITKSDCNLKIILFSARNCESAKTRENIVSLLLRQRQLTAEFNLILRSTPVC